METVRPKKKPTKIEEMSKEEIRQAILKKRECNAKALVIVESLLEPGVTDKYFLQCLPDINQAHFDDIVEERSIIHLCGYPLCQKMLSVNEIPKQKYRISLKTNKVYDITSRKNFCSNPCYNAALFIKKQMLTSPLWFRQYEVIPTFHLLKAETLGGLGEEVDLTIVDCIKLSNKKSFTSINDFAQASLVDVPDNVLDDKQSSDDKKYIHSNLTADKQIDEFTKEMNKLGISQANVLSNPEVNKGVSTNLNKDSHTGNQIKLEVSSKPTADKPKNLASNPFNIVGEIIEKPEKKVDPILLDKPTDNITKDNKVPRKSKVIRKKQPLVTALTIEVEKCLADWFTIDTMLFLFGTEKVQEMVADKGECIKEYLNNFANGLFYSSNAYDQYQTLCKKLNMLELEDRRYDSEALKRETRPLPDYTMLQEESKNMQLKVKAYFSGEMQIPELEMAKTTQPMNTEEENTTNLPLVDKNSQNALRRRIVCQHLNKVLPDLLRSLGLLSLQISNDVRLLVNTFKLKANNIMFKPIQWTLIAIIFIKLLSLRNRQLEDLLELQTAYQHMQLLLLSFNQDGGYLDRLICWLTDIDRLLDTKDTQLTID